MRVTMAIPIKETFEFEDLAAIYRVERKAPSLSVVRRDLYPAMAGLLSRLNQEYSKQISEDPDSLICEGTNQRRKKAKQLSKEIVELRMNKICMLALRGAMGAQNVVDQLTPEEKDYYSEVLEASKRHSNVVTRLAGGKKYSSPRIDPTPEPEPEPVPEREPVTVRETVTPEPAEIEEPIPEPIAEKKETAPKPAEIEYEPEPEDVPDEDFPPDEEDVEERMDEEDSAFFGDMDPEPKREVAPANIPKPEPAEETPSEKMDEHMAVIRILEDLPPFSGPDRDYSLSKEDIVRMPKTMADVLINRQKAVLITPSE